MSIGNGPKITQFSCLIFDVISLSDVISSIGPKISGAVTNNNNELTDIYARENKRAFSAAKRHKTFCELSVMGCYRADPFMNIHYVHLLMFKEQVGKHIEITLR